VITLVLGGVRSGKSEFAERVAALAAAATGDLVTYIATGNAPDGDAGAQARIAAHQVRRPQWWRTVEEPYALGKVLSKVDGVAVVDSLGTWLAHDVDGTDFDELIAVLAHRHGDTVVVSEEVGLGVHPPTALGRRFADRLGDLNQRVAAVADRVVLVTAGRPIELPATEPVAVAPGAAGETASRAGGLRAAVSFLTVAGTGAPPTPAALDWFPVVGAVVGLLLGLLWRLGTALAAPVLAAAVVVAADAAATGALHLDGVVDTADALLPPMPRARRLAVMRDPRAGAFGVVAVVTVVLVRAAALATFATGRPLLLAALWCASRTTMAVIVRAVPYARRDGLATGFGGRRPVAAVAVVGFALAALLAAIDGASALAAVPAVAVGAAAVTALAVRRLGGYTGDTIGAAGVIGETFALVVAAAVA